MKFFILVILLVCILLKSTNASWSEHDDVNFVDGPLETSLVEDSMYSESMDDVEDTEEIAEDVDVDVDADVDADVDVDEDLSVSYEMNLADATNALLDISNNNGTVRNTTRIRTARNVTSSKNERSKKIVTPTVYDRDAVTTLYRVANTTIIPRGNRTIAKPVVTITPPVIVKNTTAVVDLYNVTSLANATVPVSTYNETKLNQLLTLNASLPVLPPVVPKAKGKNYTKRAHARVNTTVALAKFDRTRGPTPSCPTCQHMRGRPKVDYHQLNNAVTFTSGPITSRFEIDEAMMRQVFSVNVNNVHQRYVFGLASMYVTNSTVFDNQNKPVASDVYKYVDFNSKGTQAPYKWDISAPQHSTSSTTDEYVFKLIGTTKQTQEGLLRPALTFEQSLLTSENITTSKFDFHVDGMDTNQWNVQANGVKSTNYLAVAFTVQQVDRFGQLQSPKPQQVQSLGPTVVASASKPVLGTEQLDAAQILTKARMGGLDIAAPNFIITGDGDKLDVIMKTGLTVDGVPALYVFYPKFEKSFVHAPLVTPNAEMAPLKSNENSAMGVNAIMVSAIAMVAAMIMFF